MHHLNHKERKTPGKSRHTFKFSLGRKGSYTSHPTVDDVVYVDNPPAPKRLHGMTSRAKNQSVKLRPKKFGPYQVVQATPHTVTINDDGLHNIVTFCQVTVSQTAGENPLDACERNCDHQSSTEYETTLKKPQILKLFVEKKPNRRQ